MLAHIQFLVQQVLSCQGALRLDGPHPVCNGAWNYSFLCAGLGVDLYTLLSCLRNKTAAFQQPHFVVDIEGNQQWVSCEDTSLPFGGIGDITSGLRQVLKKFVLGIHMGHVLELIPHSHTKPFGFSQI